MEQKSKWEVGAPNEPRPTQTEESNCEPRFSFLSPKTDKELGGIFLNLPPEILEKILPKKNNPTAKKMPGQAQLEKYFAEMAEEDRQSRLFWHKYTREDISKMDGVDAEVLFWGTLRSLLSRGENGLSHRDFMHVQDQAQFSKLLMPFLDSIWNNRGKESISPFDGREKERLEKSLSEKQNRLRSVNAELTRLEEKRGKKRRLSSAMSEQQSKLENESYDLKEETGKETRDLDKVFERQKLYSAMVFISETFSAEDFAVLVNESLYDELNHLSRRYPHANPELLDFLEQTMNEWNKNHEGELAIRPRKDIAAAKKLELLINRFSERMASYARNRNNSGVTPEMRESNEREILVVARLIRRFAKKR